MVKNSIQKVSGLLFSTAMIFLLFSNQAYAVELPNNFQPNTPASAAEVNANFIALKNAIDSLESKLNNIGNSSLPLPSKSGRLGYAAITSSGEINPNFTSYNSSGGSIIATQNSSGNYTVIFEGVAALDAVESPVILVSNSSILETVSCSAVVADMEETDVTIDVICYDLSGAGENVAFNILVIP